MELRVKVVGTSWLPRSVSSSLLLATLWLAPGCGDGGPSGLTDVDAGGEAAPDASSHVAVGLDVTPGGQVFRIVDGVAATAEFHATARYADGSTADVTHEVYWFVDSPVLGTIDASGHFTSTTAFGGRGAVRATYGAARGAAELTLVYEREVVATTTPDPKSYFDGATPDARLAPRIVYPADQTLVPQNLGELDVQWSRPTMASANLFKLELSSDTLSMRVYTSAALSGGFHHALSGADWTALAQSAVGGGVKLTVHAADTASRGRVGESSAVMLLIAPGDLQGAMYWFSETGFDTTPETGIYRQKFGAATEAPEPYFTTTHGDATYADGSRNHCPSCHVVSDDGRKIAMSMVNDAGGVFWVDSREPIVSPVAGLKWLHSDFSPDGDRLVVSVRDASALQVYDVSDGPRRGTMVGTLGAGRKPTLPAWSPDGTTIAFTAIDADCPVAGVCDAHTFAGTSIYLATVDGTGFTDERVLVRAASASESNFFPQFSPDGRWVLFNRTPNGRAMSNMSADVWVIAVDGSVGPVALTAANADGDVLNSWPVWSPFTLPNLTGHAGSLMFYSFSSRRGYGAYGGAESMGQTQVWMAAFDPGGEGVAPFTYPAFWSPIQDRTRSNHGASWTSELIDVR